MKHIETILNILKIKNISSLVIGQLNFNSFSSKFSQLKLIKEKYIDILVLTKTKPDFTFSSSQFIIDGFSMPYWCDRNRLGRGVIIHVCNHIPNQQLIKRKLPRGCFC